MQREPCGPVAVLNPDSSHDEAISEAISVQYGLAGCGFTSRAGYVDRMIDDVEVGNLSINTLEAFLPETPIRGIESSYGREGGAEGLDRYITIKNVWHSTHVV